MKVYDYKLDIGDGYTYIGLIKASNEKEAFILLIEKYCKKSITFVYEFTAKVKLEEREIE